MTPFLTRTTQHLLLRQFHLIDAKRVQQLARTKEGAFGTLLIPHPYHYGMDE